MTTCSIIPEFVFAEMVEKTANPERKSRFQAMLTDVQGFMAGLNVVKSPDGFELGAKNVTRNRVTHNCENGFTVPGKVARREGDKKHKDSEVNLAHDGAGATYDFFREHFGRNSMDDKGMDLLCHVRYGRDYANAYWDGRNMVFGEGDGQVIGSFTKVIDIIGHEMSHGVTEHTANLEYYSQPGALNEHYSDVFGSMIKQFSKNQKAKDADWLIGEGLWMPGINGRALRDMINPGTAYDDDVVGADMQPDHMNKYYEGGMDNQGVHINSGIPNKIFANVAMRLDGYSWDKAGKIWWNVLTKRLNRKSNFQNAVDAWVKEAGALYGKNSTEQKTVIDCCKLVGLKPSV